MPTTRASFRMIEFASEGATLRGRFYVHAGERRGIVIMTHGFSATISGMTADRYAEVLHAAGFQVLLYDHRTFGVSGGEPRQVINRWVHARGYRDAIDFAIAQPEVDAERIALWGDSHSGSTALAVAAFDHRVKALVVQVPACGREPPAPDPDGTAYRALREVFEHADLAALPKDAMPATAVVSFDQLRSPSLLPPITAFRWFIDYGGRPGTRWENFAIMEAPKTAVPYHAITCAPHMKAASLWCVAHDDEMPGAEPHISRLAFEACPEPKQLLEVDGGHFGLLYYPSERFDQVSAAQAAFLVRHLGVKQPRRPQPSRRSRSSASASLSRPSARRARGMAPKQRRAR